MKKSLSLRFLLITLIVLLSILPSRELVFAATDQTIDTIDLDQMNQIKKKTLQDPEYQELIVLFRSVIREQYLGNLWRETQRNPDFRFGPLKFAELFQKLEKFHLFQNMTSTSVQADLERVSDFYIIGGNWGIFNKETVESAPPEIQAALVHHVFLGAAGYQDEDYQLSLALLLLNQAFAIDAPPQLKAIDFKAIMPATENQLYRPQPKVYFGGSNPNVTSKKSMEDLKKKLLKPGNKSLQLQHGGFTGVGGGGDVVAAQTKLKMIESMFTITQKYPDLSAPCRDRWQNPTQYAKDVFDAEIESSNDLKEIRSEITQSNQVKVALPRYPAKYTKMQELTTTLAIYELCRRLPIGQ